MFDSPFTPTETSTMVMVVCVSAAVVFLSESSPGVSLCAAFSFSFGLSTLHCGAPSSPPETAWIGVAQTQLLDVTTGEAVRYGVCFVGSPISSFWGSFLFLLLELSTMVPLPQ